MVQEEWRGGGGNMPMTKVGSQIIVRRQAAIGDVVASTVVADKLAQQGFSVAFQCSPMIHPVVRRQASINSVTDLYATPHIDLDGAYEKDPLRRRRHFSAMFVERANAQLAAKGVSLGDAWNCRPALSHNESAKRACTEALGQHPRPWIFVCPASYFFAVRQVAYHVWQSAAEGMPGTKFWLGKHPGPPNMIDLKCADIGALLDYLSVADLMVSVDTGPMHIAAALGIPVLAIGQSSSPELHLSDQRDFTTIFPQLDCLNCQENICPKQASAPPCQEIDPGLISAWAKGKLRAAGEAGVSALIPTFSATAERLRRCVEAVIEQVDEVVITRAEDGKIPQGAPTGPKIRYVTKPVANIGFGKNANFGFRHTTSPYVLLLNDDVYLNPGTVPLLLKQMRPDVGMVAHLLRYPSGKIYFAGRHRPNGFRGCPHLDHNEYHPTITQPTEMEIVSTTSVLMRRKAFYDSGCFDEEFHLYAEDDDISLSFRKSGWRIMYTPEAVGTHEGSATTGGTGMVQKWIEQSAAIVERKWGWYWDKNKGNAMGCFK